MSYRRFGKNRINEGETFETRDTYEKIDYTERGRRMKGTEGRLNKDAIQGEKKDNAHNESPIMHRHPVAYEHDRYAYLGEERRAVRRRRFYEDVEDQATMKDEEFAEMVAAEVAKNHPALNNNEIDHVVDLMVSAVGPKEKQNIKAAADYIEKIEGSVVESYKHRKFRRI